MKKIKLEQFSSMNMVYNKYSFSYFLDSMERLGIRNFELWTGAPHFNNFVPSMSKISLFRNEIERRELNIVCVTPEQVLYPYNIAAENKELRELSLEYFFTYIKQTAELGADKMLCCSGWGNYDEDVNEAWKRSVESLNKMTEIAQRVGVVLAFEILCPSESNLVNNFETTVRMMNEIQSDHFSLCVDTVPIRLGGNTLGDFFEEFDDRICHVHLTDGSPTGHVPFGLGEHPLEDYLHTLCSYDYEGYITLEIGDMSWLTNPEKATEIGFSTIKECLPIANCFQEL